MLSLYFLATISLVNAELFSNDSKCCEKLLKLDGDMVKYALQMRPILPRNDNEIKDLCDNYDSAHDQVDTFVSKCLSRSHFTNYSIYMSVKASQGLNRQLCKQRKNFLKMSKKAQQLWPKAIACLNKRRETVIELAQNKGLPEDFVCALAATKHCIQSRLPSQSESDGKSLIDTIMSSQSRVVFSFLARMHPLYKSRNCTESFLRETDKNHESMTLYEPAIELLQSSFWEKRFASRVASVYNHFYSHAIETMEFKAAEVVENLREEGEKEDDDYTEVTAAKPSVILVPEGETEGSDDSSKNKEEAD